MTQDNTKQEELQTKEHEEKEDEEREEDEKADKKQSKKEQKDVSRIKEIFKTLGFEEFANYLRSPWRIMFYNFIAGIFRGLGIVVGMTVVIASLIWLLGYIVDFPLLGDYFMDLKKVLESFNSKMQ